jgi:hypothetical protein
VVDSSFCPSTLILPLAAIPPLLRNCDSQVRSEGGTGETARHALKRISGGLLARTEFTRAFASYVTKRAPECAEALPASLERDLRDGKVRVAEERGGPFDAPRE